MHDRTARATRVEPSASAPFLLRSRLRPRAEIVSQSARSKWSRARVTRRRRRESGASARTIMTASFSPGLSQSIALPVSSPCSIEAAAVASSARPTSRRRATIHLPSLSAMLTPSISPTHQAYDRLTLLQPRRTRLLTSRRRPGWRRWGDHSLKDAPSPLALRREHFPLAAPHHSVPGLPRHQTAPPPGRFGLSSAGPGNQPAEPMGSGGGDAAMPPAAARGSGPRQAAAIARSRRLELDHRPVERRIRRHGAKGCFPGSMPGEPAGTTY